eukprot:Gb_39126 [translate_table: standard]
MSTTSMNGVCVERCIREGPEWLDKLLICNYFSPCLIHKSGRPERNHFCIECNEGPICSVGLASAHHGHQTLQIRKASHHDAIRVCDIQKVLDISGIQCYSINGAKIVFLLRPKAKMHHGRSKRRCVNCKRGLNDAGMLLCSIKCKLSAVRESLRGGLNAYINTNTTTNNNGGSNSIISLSLSSTRGGQMKPQPIVIREAFSAECISNSCSHPLKKRIRIKERSNDWLMSMGVSGDQNIEGHGNGDIIFSPVSPISVLNPSRSSHSNTANINPCSCHHHHDHTGECHCEEGSILDDVKRSPFRISMPPLEEDGELTSSPDNHQHLHGRLHKRNSRKNRRKHTPHRSPLW